MLRPPHAACGPNSHPYQKPAHDFFLPEQTHDVLEEILFGRKVLELGGAFAQPMLDFRGRIAGPQKASPLAVARIRLARFLQQLMPHEPGRSERSARVAGRGLDPNIVERPFAQQPPIGHAIQGNAAGQHQISLHRFFMQIAAEPQHHVFRHHLDACRQIHVPLQQVGFRRSRRPAE